MATADDFPLRHVVTTRWADNDMYAHVNNAAYYAYFDSAINAWLARHLDTGFERATVIGVVAESGCRYLRPISFPGDITVGVRITRLGRTSVTYQLGIFEGAAPASGAEAAALGHWVHVYVERETGRACPIPEVLRSAMEGLVSEGVVT